MATPVDLCARGERVVLSSESSSRKDERPSAGKYSSPQRKDPISLSPARKPTPHHSLFHDQIGQLSKTLTFAEGAGASLGVDICSYSTARQNSRRLFTHHNMEIFADEAKHGSSAPTGRHNSRGPGDRHLPCHLTHPQGAGLVIPPLERRKGGKMSKSWNQSIRSRTEEITLPPSPKNYIQQLEAGAKPLYTPGKERTIVLDNNTAFKKVLQVSYPPPPSKYITSQQTKPSTKDKEEVHHRRWLDVPQPVEPSADFPWESFSVSSSSHLSDFEDARQKSSADVLEQPERHEFFTIMREWCGQWQLHIRLREVGDNSSLVQQMSSVSDHTRMYAVAAIAVLAENQAVMALKARSPQPEFTLEPLSPPSASAPWAERKVSNVLVEELKRLLDDSTVHVRVPSALTLYCMSQQTQEAEGVLHAALTEGVRSSERWAAVQCLVCAGGVSPAIVSELLLHLLDSHSPAEQQRATALLAMASLKTNLVHSMVADRLNNSGWQERLAACTVLPLLHDGINRDMYTKLLELAWEDWSPEVQHAAAKALGMASHGKIVHDDIINRLKDQSVLVRLDAIRKLHSLQLMTVKLLPSYLTCFNDQHLSIRLEAVALAGSLQLRNPLVMKALKLQLRDNNWMLKTSSLKALADIGLTEPDTELVELLIWAVRFEKVPAVRAQACRTIARLGLKEDKVVETLKALVTVEDVDTVVFEAKLTLTTLGHTEPVRDPMLEGVCENVKRLGTKEAITQELLTAEVNTITDYRLRRPTFQLTVRDYLDHKQRNLAYGEDSAASSGKRSCSGKRSYRDTSSKHGRTRSVWTPDKQTIESQLDKMRQRVRSCI